MIEDRVISPEMEIEDIQVENSLRPKRFDEYIGQEKVKDSI